MKKRYIILVAFLSFLFVNKVEAASCSIVASSTSIKPGGSVTVRVSSNAIGRFNLSSSELSGGGSVWTEGGTSSESVRFTSSGPGSYRITATSVAGLSDSNGNPLPTLSCSTTINVKSAPTPQPVVKDNRSGNNNLKSLSVEGYEISPKFDSSKKEYTLNLTYDITKIIIKAEKEHNKASISGDTGEKEVKVGDNNFSITVKAENGNTKTYKLKVIVDSKPIKVTIDGKEYTVIKKKEELPELKIEHEDKELNLEDQNVPAFRIESIKYTLIGLQDSEGNKYLCRFKAYKAEEKPTEYTLFNPISVSEMYVNIEDFPKSKIPANYSKYEEEINGIKVTVYKLNKSSKYSLIYGTNILTGNTNIYRYDSYEKTIQIYEREEAKNLEELIENGKKLVLILGGVILFLIILTTIGFSRKPKVKEVKIKDNKSNDLSNSDIKKIEKDTSKSNKKELKRQKRLEKKEKKASKKRQRKGEPEL